MFFSEDVLAEVVERSDVLVAHEFLAPDGETEFGEFGVDRDERVEVGRDGDDVDVSPAGVLPSCGGGAPIG